MSNLHHKSHTLPHFGMKSRCFLKNKTCGRHLIKLYLEQVLEMGMNITRPGRVLFEGIHSDSSGSKHLSDLVISKSKLRESLGGSIT